MTRGGSDPVRIGDGEISWQLKDGQHLWVYRDSAPGSTDLYGPAIDAPQFTPALARVIFRSPRHQALDGKACLSGERSPG